MTIIEAFAERNRLRTKLDEFNDPIIPGRYGQIYDYEDGKRLGVIYIPVEPDVTPSNWNRLRTELLAAGCQIKNDGDGEGIALFDPANPKQARLAIRVAGVKRIRALSPAQLEAAANERRKIVLNRQNSAPRGRGVQAL